MKLASSIAHLGTLASLLLGGCMLFAPPAAYTAQSQEQAVAAAKESSDAQMLASLEQSRTQVKQSPGSVDPARVFAQNVLGVFELGTVERKHLDAEALVREASAAIDAALDASPEQAAELYFSKGTMLLSAKKTDEGIAALRASMDAKASPRACVALVAELRKAGDPKKEITGLCKRALPNAASDETRFALLDGCLADGAGVDEGLAWAGGAQIAFYKEYQQKIEADNEAYRAKQKADSDRMFAEMDAARARADAERAAQKSSGSSSGGSPAGGGNWSLSLKNSCPKTVRLFLGNKPKFGSGTTTTLGANTISSYSGRAGDMIWIVDDHDNGMSSLSPSGSQRMQITPSCSGFAPN